MSLIYDIMSSIFDSRFYFFLFLFSCSLFYFGVKRDFLWAHLKFEAGWDCFRISLLRFKNLTLFFFLIFKVFLNVRFSFVFKFLVLTNFSALYFRVLGFFTILYQIQISKIRYVNLKLTKFIYGTKPIV